MSSVNTRRSSPRIASRAAVESVAPSAENVYALRRSQRVVPAAAAPASVAAAAPSPAAVPRRSQRVVTISTAPVSVVPASAAPASVPRRSHRVASVPAASVPRRSQRVVSAPASRRHVENTTATSSHRRSSRIAAMNKAAVA
jgi:hypothetical protein